MASIVVDNIQKSFDSVAALKQVSLEVKDGEFMTLVGASGCGKSTLLRIIAGLEPQTAGDVVIDDTNVNGIRPSERNLAMVFQSYALYPHLNVFDNIAVPLRMRYHGRLQRIPLLRWLVPGTRIADEKIRKKVVDTATSLGLGELLNRKPGQLSGGQRQRVAVGRAIVRDPKAFLLDEPLSNLDAKMRVHMRTEISQLHRQLKATFIYVTHDQAEAMTMSDRIAVMMDGQIIQTGTPDDIYHRPTDIRVAEFIGSPKINILPAAIDASGEVRVLQQATSLRCNGSIQSLGIRPEACMIAEPSHSGDRVAMFQGTVSHIENFGAEIFLQTALEGVTEPLVIRSDPSVVREFSIGDSLPISLDLSRAHAFDGSGRRIPLLESNVDNVGDAIKPEASAKACS